MTLALGPAIRQAGRGGSSVYVDKYKDRHTGRVRYSSKLGNVFKSPTNGVKRR
jgi:hypothetical protein